MLKSLTDVLRRNQRHLIEIPNPVKKPTECRQQNTVAEQSPTEESKGENSLVQAPTTPVLKTRSGRIVTKPKRFSDYLVYGDCK
jgi:hypothetical protein